MAKLSIVRFMQFSANGQIYFHVSWCMLSNNESELVAHHFTFKDEQILLKQNLTSSGSSTEVSVTRPFMPLMPPYIMSTVISPTLVSPCAFRKALISSCVGAIFDSKTDLRSEEAWRLEVVTAAATLLRP